MARFLTRGMVQQTVWLNADEFMDTGMGRMTKLAWLEKECARICKDPTRQAEVRWNPRRPACAALFVNDVRVVGARV